MMLPSAATILVALLAALLAALLVLPTHVRAAGHLTFDQIWGQAEARWGWGLVGVRVSGEGAALHLLGVRVLRFSGKDDGEKDADERQKKRKKKRRSSLGLLRRHGRTGLRVVLRLLRALDPRIHVSGIIGLDDPADTAMLCEQLRLLNQLFPYRIEMALVPEWNEERVDVQGVASLTLWPPRLIAVALAMLWSVEVRQMLREVT